MRLNLEDILVATEGTLLVPDRECLPYIDEVSIDSRSITPGSLFACVVGKNFDGHNFALQAVKEGASAILANYNPFIGSNPVPVIIVSDTIKSLGQLAHSVRNQTKATVIGVTGTAGKTTVKELIAQLLEKKGQVAKSYLNFNTQLGMAVSILSTKGNEDFWVMEVGISEAQDMDELGAILKPDIGLIVNVGSAHISGLGAQGVAYHKARLLNYVKEQGIGIISMDYSELMREVSQYCLQKTFFSIYNDAALYYGKYIGVTGNGQSIHKLSLNKDEVEITTSFLGGFGTESIIASATVAHVLGVTKQDIIQGFNQAMLPKQRFSWSYVGDWLCIDDSYNANPLSMKQMAEATTILANGKKPLVYVLGEMFELGDSTEKEHEKLGYILARTKAAVIFWKGNNIDAIITGLKKGKFSGVIQSLGTEENFPKLFQQYELDKGIIVFKGSRSNKMETFLESFISWAGKHNVI